MKKRILVLGAGFAGLELVTLLSDALGDTIDATLIDQSDHFVFGFSKLDVTFGKKTPDAVKLPYRNIVKPGVRFLQRTVTSIDPEARRVTTDQETLEADYLIVGLGADYDYDATPGLITGGNEFYSVAGATRLRDVLTGFTSGHAIVGVCDAPFKCPPAPSEAALMLHDHLVGRGIRDRCEITLVIPFGKPVPPSPDTSTALIAAFAERKITFIPDRKVKALDGSRRTAILDDGAELPYDLFLGVPKHRVPSVVEASGMVENGWVAVNPRTLETKWPGVFAVGDLANTGTPKAGVFAEGTARSVASTVIAEIRGAGQTEPNAGAGSCYIEFGGGRVGRVDVDFFSGPKPTGVFHGASTELRADKDNFGATRRRRWFGTA